MGFTDNATTDFNTLSQKLIFPKDRSAADEWEDEAFKPGMILQFRFGTKVIVFKITNVLNPTRIVHYVRFTIF